MRGIPAPGLQGTIAKREKGVWRKDEQKTRSAGKKRSLREKEDIRDDSDVQSLIAMSRSRKTTRYKHPVTGHAHLKADRPSQPLRDYSSFDCCERSRITV
jgi:hypothetical protein